MLKFYALTKWLIADILSFRKNCIEKSAAFLFQSPAPKTKPNEGKLMDSQFTGPEIISHCRFLPNNKSITIMIYPCNFFINIYACCLLLYQRPAPANYDESQTVIGAGILPPRLAAVPHPNYVARCRSPPTWAGSSSRAGREASDIKTVECLPSLIELWIVIYRKD